MRDLAVGILAAYCSICTLILLRDIPAWLLLPVTVSTMLGLLVYIGWDLKRALRWKRVARRLSE